MKSQLDIVTPTAQIVTSMINAGMIKDAGDVEMLLKTTGSSLISLQGGATAVDTGVIEGHVTSRSAAPQLAAPTASAAPAAAPRVSPVEAEPEEVSAADNSFKTAAELGQQPACPIKDSVTPDYIVCLEDGKKMKMLKRHITKLGMTPEGYKRKWGLPDEYPLTAPNYSQHKSMYAKETGLGTARKGTRKRKSA